MPGPFNRLKWSLVFRCRLRICCAWLLARGFQQADKAPLVQTILEGFSAIDANHRNFSLEHVVSRRILQDVHFSQGKLIPLLKHRELLFCPFAEAAARFGINYDLSHAHAPPTGENSHS